MVEPKPTIDVEQLRDDLEARQQPLRSLFRDFGEQAASGNTRLTGMPFNARCQNCLRHAGIVTLSELNCLSVNQLMALPAFGWGTLKNLFDVYENSFQISFSSRESLMLSGQSQGLDWELEDDETYEVLSGASRLGASFRAESLVSLAFPRQVRTTLERLQVTSVGDLLNLSPGQVVQCRSGGRETASAIRERLTELVEKRVLVGTVQKALSVQPLRCGAMDAAAAALDIPTDKVRERILTVPGVVILADRAYWVAGCQDTLLPQWEFESYTALLQTVLQTGLSPRQGEVVSDYYGLFSEPLSRRELAAKQGVVPQRIYQILKRTRACLQARSSLLSLLWLPIRELLRQHPGVLTSDRLERGLVECFGCSPGEIRGANLLAMLEDYQDGDGLTVAEARMVVQPPVTAAGLREMVNIVFEQLMDAPLGVPEEEVQQALPQYWERAMPGHPVPNIVMSDLAWMHPKIVLKDGTWRVLRRRQRRRVTDRLTRPGLMEAVLNEQGRPMLVQDLFDACRERCGEINVPASRTALKKYNHVFRAYERGVYGLVGWRDYAPSELQKIRLQSRRSTPRTSLDKIEAVLEDNGLPMHFQDLLRAFQDRFDEGEDRGVRSALLIRPDRFQLHGNGVYGLTAWGEDAATVLEEAVIDFLEERGYPASETEICDRLREQFPISVPVGRWALRKAWECSGSVVPLEGGLWDVADEDAAEGGPAGVSVDDLLLEQLLSC